MNQSEKKLVGLYHELDEIIYDFAYLADRHKEFHPANSGDVSQVLPAELSIELIERYGRTATDWFHISEIQNLAKIRADDRSGYRAEGIEDEAFYRILQSMKNKLMLITRTGAEIAAIKHTIEQGRSGQLLTLVEVNGCGNSIRIIYGCNEYGSIPSIETHIHLMANAISISEDFENPSLAHAHPFHLVTLGREKKIAGDFGLFNTALYTQVEGINRNHPSLVGIIPWKKTF